ncbi:MAG: hypothetical protein Q8L45_01430 [Xanthomonadaceae bacterium]|nr:hypothetical protein [Xanthomonadaceae bacterium]MDP2185721.1 hypothetical protein [Xanthomonadales bacterium]MDZ4115004.1 hypothetical protein [Xanthomonadaceae bacterium]MDZ4378086.1 hypothetical protein [Xanthomonadaceae bacterium]
MAPSPPLIAPAAAVQATLSAIVPTLHHHCREPWWLIGSAALHVAGVPDIAVHDIDVLVSDADAVRLLAHWHERIDNAFQPERSDLFRSRFGRISGFALPLEVMGNLELFRDGTWQPVRPADREVVEWRGLSVPVPSLVAQCAILESFGRAKDIARAHAVKQMLRARGQR